MLYSGMSFSGSIPIKISLRILRDLRGEESGLSAEMEFEGWGLRSHP